MIGAVICVPRKHRTFRVEMGMLAEQKQKNLIVVSPFYFIALYVSVSYKRICFFVSFVCQVISFSRSIANKVSSGTAFGLILDDCTKQEKKTWLWTRRCWISMATQPAGNVRVCQPQPVVVGSV